MEEETQINTMQVKFCCWGALKPHRNIICLRLVALHLKFMHAWSGSPQMFWDHFKNAVCLESLGRGF